MLIAILLLASLYFNPHLLFSILSGICWSFLVISYHLYNLNHQVSFINDHKKNDDTYVFQVLDNNCVKNNAIVQLLGSNTKLFLTFPENMQCPDTFSTWRALSRIKPIKYLHNRDVPTSESYALSKKVFGHMVVKSNLVKVSDPSYLYNLLNRMNQFITTFIHENFFPSYCKPYVKALLLGDTNDLTIFDWDSYKNAGIVHLLAISGLHITILVDCIEKLLGLFRLPNYLNKAIIILTIWLYGVITNLAIPTQRALISTSISNIKTLNNWLVLDACHHKLSHLSLTLLIMLSYNPFLLSRMSFWLSFSAVFVMRFNYTRFREEKYTDTIYGFICMQLRLTVFMSILQWYFFDTVPLISFLVTYY